MALTNQVQMSGYVATDVKVFGNDRNVGRVRIRHDRSKKSKTGEWEKEASFFSMVVFGGEDVERLLDLKKGDKIMVLGRLQQTERETDGQKREFIDIVANEFAFVPTPDRAQPPGPVGSAAVRRSTEAMDFLDVS